MTKYDNAVFDAANDNSLFDNPAEYMDDDAPASARKSTTPDERAAARQRLQVKRDAEAKRMAAVRVKLDARQAIGDPACEANDNEDIPLLKTLRKAGDAGRVSMVMKYRSLVALCAAEPLQGQTLPTKQVTGVENETRKMRGVEDVERAAADGFKNDRVAGGEITYKGVRKPKGGRHSSPATRKVAANDNTTASSAPVARRFSDDVLIAQIDAKPFLAELQAAMGPLIEPFEDAVLCGATLGDVGRATGATVKPEIAGKALVFSAMDALSDAWSQISGRERRLAAEAMRNVERRRRELAQAA